MSDLGIDLVSSPDLDFRLVTGERALAEALLRRLSTPRGGLFSEPAYGYDLRMLLNEAMSEVELARAQMAIEAEIQKDERVTSVDTRLDFDAQRERLRLTAAVTTSDGPFQLILGVDRVTVELMKGPE
jgi:phage baseplate assembly protein W